VLEGERPNKRDVLARLRSMEAAGEISREELEAAFGAILGPDEEQLDREPSSRVMSLVVSAVHKVRAWTGALKRVK